MIDTALADVQQTKAAWTAPDLTRALSNALPDQLGTSTPQQVGRLLDGLTAEALKLAVPLDADRPGDADLPDDLRLADGSSAYQAPGGQLYATPDHLDHERLLAAATADRHAPAISKVEANRFIADLAAQGIELGADQAAAVRGVLTSGARGRDPGRPGRNRQELRGRRHSPRPGPTRALWAGQPRRVVGLAASQIATEVLAGEGLDARNIARWLATQDRLAAGTRAGRRPALAPALGRPGGGRRVSDGRHPSPGPHPRPLPAGRGEAAADRRPPPARRGRRGRRHGPGRRHRQPGTSWSRPVASPSAWEGAASLRLRAHDQTVLAEYHKHGRLLDGGALEQAETAAARAWLADTLTGRHSLLIVDTNEQVARLSAQLRADLVRLGRVDDERTVPLGLQGTWAGVGDIVQARRNGWHLAGYDGNRRGPINREQYRVTAVRDDGGLEVDSPPGRQRPGRRVTASSCRPTTSPSTWRSATPPPSTPPRASPSTPATPSSPRPPQPTRSTSA